MIKYSDNKDFVCELEDGDELSQLRNEFIFPRHNGKEAIYFCGNSLGLQPKAARQYLNEELEDWAQFGVEGHFQSRRPWFGYHHFFTKSLAKLVGAKETEVVAMNQLTVNLQLLMLSFYKPTKTRHKIIMEGGAFPSDMYAMESQVKFHGLNPKTSIVELSPKKNEHTISTADIIKSIEKHGKSVAVLMMGGVNYYTGQVFDMKQITKTAHKYGIKVGFDLAHAVGNIPLELNTWGVDFACWCSYKYLNSGPGAVGGIYINEKHATNSKTPRLAGWWGYDEKSRFKMQKGFIPIKNAQSWQMSNAPVMNMACLRASLDIFDKVDMNKLRQKSILMTGFLDFLLRKILDKKKGLKFEIITPTNISERGCQLSLLFKKDGKKVFKALQEAGIIVDWREPNVIRLAPVPLYNTYSEIYEFYEILNNF